MATLLLVATALHLGFQATVTVLVYPALARCRAGDWAAVHAAHTRGIAPLVVIVYGLLVVAGLAAVVTSPDDPWVWVAGAGALAAGVVTAVRAAPLHGRLGAGHDPALLRSLLRADRARLVAAVVALVGAVLAGG